MKTVRTTSFGSLPWVMIDDHFTSARHNVGRQVKVCMDTVVVDHLYNSETAESQSRSTWKSRGNRSLALQQIPH